MGMHCRNCHYALEGLTGPPHRCPECGGEFDPNDPRTVAVSVCRDSFDFSGIGCVPLQERGL